MPGFKDMPGLETVYYGSGGRILKDFLLPALDRATAYDRVTGYFNLDALLAISQGLEGLYRRGGRMRLAVGIHAFPKDAAEAVAGSQDLRGRIIDIRRNLLSDIMGLADSLQKDRLATVALMIEDGFLKVKAVDTSNGHCIFHSKLLIMRDEEGDAVAAMGSINETGSGLGGNFENLMVLHSWIDGDGVRKQQDIFSRTWAGREAGIIVQDLTKDLARDIIDGLGQEHMNRVRLRLKQRASILDAPKMPSYFFVSGAIPALYQHQERAVLDGLSRWPVRVLYSDEVGLGKTYEVAATIAYLVRFCGAKRVVILTPKSVLTQWQDELCENFGIDAWRYDSASKEYVSHEGLMRKVRNGCPIGGDMPSVALISAQYARGSNRQVDIFSMPDAVLPDVLAVDEAHAARVSFDIGGKRKTTRLYRVLREVAPKIPHVILATATPMQKDAVEYHSLLGLLGLPGHWSREKAFNLSLRLIGSDEPLALSELGSAPILLREVIESMHPSLRQLDANELDLLERLSETDSKQVWTQLASIRWESFRSLFIKLHPARLLTVRNTRRSLEDVGYVFPRRDLSSVTLTGYGDVEKFYSDINFYIGSTYLGAEKVLFPDRKFSDGFVKSSYQQRMASSLYSCGRSLAKRKAKLLALRDLVTYHERSKWDIESDLDDEDQDDAMLGGMEADENAGNLTGKATREYRSALEDVDSSQVLRAINAEVADILPLMTRLEELRARDGDPKVDRSIDAIIERLDAGDQVLAFSRYTDTVDALLERWKLIDGGATCYGVYTGQRSDYTLRGATRKATKDEIKRLLNAGEIKVMFCSDAASEGLNLQAARVLVNVDVPWTPARLEQRIGRVARLGQRAPSVDIINVWYPHSVEERMYTRIDQRLKGYNLAVGEFPEVVAESIRRSILDDDVEDDSMRLLQDIRNSLQTEALSALWHRGSYGQTTSKAFRMKLLDDIAERARYETSDSGETTVYLRDGETETVTPEEGNRETISLSSKCVIEYYPSLSGYLTAIDGDGRDCAYACGDSILNPELLPEALGGTTDFSSLETNDRPKWLPDVDAMSLAYTVEYEPPVPSMWPPRTGGER